MPNSMLSNISLRLVKTGSSQSTPSKKYITTFSGTAIAIHTHKESKKFEVSRKKFDSA